MPTPLELFQTYYTSDPTKDEVALQKAPPAMWDEKGKEFALKSFQIVAERVPAYKDFLKKHSVDSTKITTYEAFQEVPLTDKESYLMQYPLDQLCLDGNLSQTNIISSSSGSSGKPFYWPRLLDQDLGIAKILELLYIKNFAIDHVSTLLLDNLGMGVWTAGEMMLSSGKTIAAKGYPLTVMSPGIDLGETIKILRNVAPYYEQVFIIGYPAFVKDIIDLAITEGIDIAKMKLKVLVGGEVHTESWRDYVFKHAQLNHEFKDITSVLGSSEGGIVGVETPMSVYLRRACYKQPKLHTQFFGHDTLPSIVQFNPLTKFIEAVDHELVLTNLGGIPLVRYNTKDRGGLLTITEIIGHLAKAGISQEVINKAIGSAPWSLPFAYLFGRSNLTATIYAVNVYPESIKSILLAPEFQGKITGRFAMQTSEDEKSNQYLEFFVELGPKHQNGDVDEQYLAKYITDHLKTVNSEFRKLTESVTRPGLVQVHNRPFQDRKYFSSDKQKFIIVKPHA